MQSLSGFLTSSSKIPWVSSLGVVIVKREYSFAQAVVRKLGIVSEGD